MQYKNLFSPRGEFERTMRNTPRHVHKPDTGFLENWQMSLNMTMYEDMSNSRDRVLQKYRDRNWSILMDAKERGEIPERLFSAFSKGGVGRESIDEKRLTRYVKRHYNLEDLMTEEDMVEHITPQLEVMRKSQAEMLRRSSLWGKVGMFAGAIHADMLDPMFFPTYFVGYGGVARAATLLSRLGIAARVGLFEGGMEALRQPFVHRWKNETGLDYSFSDAMKAIITTTAVAGGMAAGAEGLAHGLRKLARKVTPKDNLEQLLVRKINQAADEMAKTPPDEPTIKAVDHGKNIETEVEYQQTREYDPWEEWEDTEASLYYTGVDLEAQRFETQNLPTSRKENSFTEEDIPKLKEELEQARGKVKEAIQNKEYDKLDDAQKRSTLLNDALNGVESRARIPLKNRIINVARTIAENDPSKRVRLSQINDALPDVDLEEFKTAVRELQNEHEKLTLMQLDDPNEIKAADRAAAIRFGTAERHIAYFDNFDQLPEYKPTPRPKAKTTRRRVTSHRKPPIVDSDRLTDEVVDASFEELKNREGADLTVPTEKLDADGNPITENVVEGVERTEKQHEAVNRFKENCIVKGE